MKQNKKTELQANFATGKAEKEAILTDSEQVPDRYSTEDSEVYQAEDSANKNISNSENALDELSGIGYLGNELLPAADIGEDELIKVSRPDRRKKLFGILLMLGSSVCVCLGQMFWRLYAEKYWGYLVLGCVFFIVSAVFTILAYRFGKLSELQPILSLNYPMSMIIAYIMFGEKITLTKIIAIIIISTGVVLIAGGKTNERKPR